MKPAAEDLAGRRPVWEALSEMFLDTEVSDGQSWRATRLARSPYSLEELEEILIEEVYPICKDNLYSVAGVWEGFDLAWLEQSILQRNNARFKFMRFYPFGRRGFLRSSDWLSTKRSIETQRNAEPMNAA